PGRGDPARGREKDPPEVRALTAMPPAALLLAVATLAPAPASPGHDGRPEVEPPRIDTTITVDGRLDEPVWTRAALLTGFSQYSPNDGVPASDTTQVLVWYSPTAIYFGIRAFERHGSPTASLADRDQIFGDDNIQILLGAGPARERVLRRPVGPARRAHRPAPRSGHGHEPGGDGQGDGRPRPRPRPRERRIRVRRRPAGGGRKPALGTQQQPHPQRHRQARLLAGGSGRRAAGVRSTPGAVLSGEAPVLPGGQRALPGPQQPHLHPPDRAAGRRGQAHRQRVRRGLRPAVGGGPEIRFRYRPGSPGRQPAPCPAQSR